MNLGSALSKNAESEEIVYSRQLIYAGSDRSVLALRLFAPEITGENLTLAYPSVSNDDSLVAASLQDKFAVDFVVPAKAEEAHLKVEVYAQNAGRLLLENASSLQPSFELINITKGAAVSSASVGSLALSDTVKLAATLSLPLRNIRGDSVRIQLALAGFDASKTRGTLTHEYGAYSANINRGNQPSMRGAVNSRKLFMQARPNPFNPSTQIYFTLPATGLITLRLFDVNGRLVREWREEQRLVGEHVIFWDGRDQLGQLAASGIYFAELIWGKERQNVKMMLLR